MPLQLEFNLLLLGCQLMMSHPNAAAWFFNCVVRGLVNVGEDVISLSWMTDSMTQNAFSSSKLTGHDDHPGDEKRKDVTKSE